MIFSRKHVLTAQDLLGKILEEFPDLRVGWPDESVRLRLRDVEELRTSFRAVLADFRKLWKGASTFADIDVAPEYRRLDVRVARTGTRLADLGIREEEVRSILDGWIAPLSQSCTRNGGSAHRGWTGSYFGMNLPVQSIGEGSHRLDFPDLPQERWEARYRAKLLRTTWSSLRSEVFRFCDLASAIASWCVASRATSVLIPSVGICVHPWVFAEHGLSVIATDIATTALDTVRHPERLSQVYGLTAKRRWEISENAAYGGEFPHGFDSMPEIDRAHVADRLRERITFVEADWVALPLPEKSIDVVFATNALPRENADLRRRALEEWARVIRPGGLVFSAMHNAFDRDTEALFESRGWHRIDALGGETSPARKNVYQDYRSSG